MKREEPAGERQTAVPEAWLGAVGICAKAGRTVCGTQMICEALKKKEKPVLVIAAGDNSQNTEKRLRDRCAYYHVPLYLTQTDGERLAKAVGKGNRISAVAITEERLGRMVAEKLPQRTESE